MWSPDGRELFYEAGDGNLLALPVETEPTVTPGPPIVLFDTTGYGTPTTVGANRRIDISPDGTRFLMFDQSLAFELDAPDPVLVQNWTDELQRLVPTP